MLPGYCFTTDGLIKHVSPPPFKYGKEYVEDRYTEKKFVDIADQKNAASLDGIRLGYMIAANDGIVPSSVMDVGYGSGSFLALCKRIIPNCYGYDISGYPLPEGVTRLSCIDEQKVQIATFFDSLEHFHSLEFLKNLPAQMIIISVPWCHYWQVEDGDEWMKEWRHLRDNGEHLWHGDFLAWRNLFDRMGYEAIFRPSFIEDTIRTRQYENLPNILTMAFRKKTG